MYLILESQANVITSLGEYLVTSVLGVTYKNIVIQPKINCLQWGRILSKSLTSGRIDQTYYDAIVNNEGEARIIHQIGTITIQKTELIELIDNLGLKNVSTEGDSATIIAALNTAGYQVII